MAASLQAHADSLALLQALCAAAQRPPVLHATVALLRADLDADIFPGLLDAMAGSDAVCIREMRDRLLAMLDALAPQRDGQALRVQCRAIVDFETRELLPMADRLLDDAALARISAAMRARRAAVG